MAAVMLGFTMAAAVMVTLMRVMSIKRIFGYATPIDVSFTSLMIWMFHGTLAGMSGAAVGGLVLAVTLSAGKWMFGAERAKIRRSGRFKMRTETVRDVGAVGRVVQWIMAQHMNAKARITT